MASASDSRSNGVSGRIKSAATIMHSENQSLLAELRKALIMMKEIGVELERDNQSRMVKELENSVVELLSTYENCNNFSLAIQSVGNIYEPKEELTDFGKLLDDEVAKVSQDSSSNLMNHSIIRQFREAVWNVHHAGQPMPGEEKEDIVMTSTQCNLLNVTCPLSGKPVIELTEPVRSAECKHVYEKAAIMQYLKSKKSRAQCPVAACPKMLQSDKVVPDPFLQIEIDELRKISRHSDRIQDFTELDAD
ncbi:E3 SUMO-protein ligase MMS21 isoform X1 [Benincasa hispida]|uniref:E3 SUMO-protein ligase MMS21 isoform X1 n=2 Tax=Benincasa hispida TaxID=102211 RepID=UPI0018FFEFF0|nr:E3 SUMO-protein ligase MMS21 isoform X1 [Benincasa hispida]